MPVGLTAMMIGCDTILSNNICGYRLKDKRLKGRCKRIQHRLSNNHNVLEGTIGSMEDFDAHWLAYKNAVEAVCFVAQLSDIISHSAPSPFEALITPMATYTVPFSKYCYGYLCTYISLWCR